MKKLLTYSFLFLFLYSAIGYFPLFLLRQNSIRSEIKRQIKNSVPENKLKVFSLSNVEYSQLKWEKKGKEFHYENSMYDIVKTSIDEQGNIVLHCINDIQEKQLFAGLEELVQKTSSSDKTLLKIFKLSSSSFFTIDLFSIFYSQQLLSYPEPVFLFSSFKSRIPSPPPELG